MTTRRLTTLALLLAALLAVGACGKKSPDDSKVLATVNGEAITEKDYDDYLRARQQQQPMPLPGNEGERRKLILDEMVSRVLLAQGAIELKADQELDVFLRLKRQRENVLAQAMLRKYFRDSPITDDEIQKRLIRDEFRTRHILVKSEHEAQDVIAELQRGANFAQLAKAKSVDVRSGKQGGDLGWISQEDAIVPQFFNAVAGMKKGETSQAPVRTNFGWHVIRIDDVRPHKPRSAEQLAGEVRMQIQQERVDALVKSLREKAKVKISE
jgi:peptidyl-prolyl cis-trans isomerase C